MTYGIWLVFASALIGGAVGGFVSVLMSGSMKAPQGVTGGADPGAPATIFIGAVAGAVAWAPGIATLTSGGKVISAIDCLAAGLAAVLVGLQGAKWLTNEADKKNLQSAAALAASKRADPDAATAIGAAGNSLAALKIANQMQR